MKRLIATTLILLYSISLFFGIGKIVQADDLLESAFQESIANEHIIMLGNGKKAVGNDVFREWSDINTSSWLKKACFINGTEVEADNENHCNSMWGERKRIDLQKRPPLVVRIAKLLLRLTVALAITMVLYNWVMRIVESIQGSENSEKARKNLIFVVWWLLLALSSIAIVNLISSISISSLKNVEEYVGEDYRGKFEEFCSRAQSNQTNRNNAAQRPGRTNDKLQFFCNPVSQPINRTEAQRNSFMLRAVQNPGSWTQDDFYNFIQRVESQFGYTIDLE